MNKETIQKRVREMNQYLDSLADNSAQTERPTSSRTPAAGARRQPADPHEARAMYTAEPDRAELVLWQMSSMSEPIEHGELMECYEIWDHHRVCEALKELESQRRIAIIGTDDGKKYYKLT